MKISIVIPLYNKQDTVRRAVYSVLDQESKHAQLAQIIIVDDGSSDNSLNIVKRIQDENEHRDIIIFSQDNAGVSAARNKGIELASHSHIALLDADDSYEPHFLDEIAQLRNSYPKANVYCTSYRFVNTKIGRKRDAKIYGLQTNDQPQCLDNFFLSAAKGDLPITSSSVCIQKSALDKIGGFPAGENMGEDQAVWSQLALNEQIAISNRVSANYFEDSNNSLMQTISPNKEMPFSQRLQNQLDRRLIPEKLRPFIRTYIAGHLLDLVRRNIQSGNLATAMGILNDKRSRTEIKRWAYWHLKLFIIMNMTNKITLQMG